MTITIKKHISKINMHTWCGCIVYIICMYSCLYIYIYIVLMVSLADYVHLAGALNGAFTAVKSGCLV